jgi:transposase
VQIAQKAREIRSDFAALSRAELLHILNETSDLLAVHRKHLDDQDQLIREQAKHIRLLEEYLRLAKVQRFGASSEQVAFQSDLFDEVELETTLGEYEQELAEEELVRPRPTKRQRGFSETLPRVQIRHTLPEEEKRGAIKTFFTKVKEEIDFIPARVQVIEHWQEKAVFERDGEEVIVAARRPAHPLGKCCASVSLLAYVVASKYADGLPLYRLDGILDRSDAGIDRSSMAHWVVRLGDDVFRPLIHLMRDMQLEADDLQGDETRIRVLKEPGRSVRSNKWMWVIRGGPPGKPAVLFEYDPSRGGSVPVRLLEGFSGVLQADGYSGYNAVCQREGITRIGCLDHARRKFVEATRAAGSTGSKKKAGPTGKADVALGKIRKLYAIEREIQGFEPEQKHQARQEHSVPVLDDLKPWLESNLSRVPKGSLTHQAIAYTLNQWEYLIGDCRDGRLHISNALAENAIRPFAVGRKSWLFADTPHGARASATCYSLVETAKINGLEPYAYLKHVLERIADADTVEKLEALLPWNVKAAMAG